ncbi:hypothetical protein HJP15_03875 [Pseudoalteromonas sp. NEC-BIFX-2020_002]|uniref:hypothetical protein n=1 Tax=Pseudoalteromonas sp. NEC-BIFX-2020_002 TaxID=2732353 RepID=UPI001476D2C2|nr:hypothetical protein [Pseudoalteromonas sp. NEC-BIFX-2020_002]NNG42090.1 hypothetical protein [Pseudoalteromonas sp. NEC-BIFX-2020_002]
MKNTHGLQAYIVGRALARQVVKGLINDLITDYAPLVDSGNTSNTSSVYTDRVL